MSKQIEISELDVIHQQQHQQYHRRMHQPIEQSEWTESKKENHFNKFIK